jgi:HK97 family phage prohead protease
MMRNSFSAAVRAVGARGFKFVGATSRLGRDGHVLIPSCLSLGNYKRNPIILWQHNPSAPVARCTAISVVDGELRGTAEFPPAGTSETADEVCGLVKSGVVSAVSIGFDVSDAEPLDPKRPHGGKRITQSELLEISLVSVPADTGAVITERAHRSSTNMMSGDHLTRAEEAVDAAARHHHDLGRAMERGDRRGAAQCHAELGRCLRSAQSAFKSAAAASALQDLQNNQETQNSGGMGPGVSASYTAPETRLQRQAEAARLGGPVIGAIAAREREVVLERARLEACAAAGCYSRPSDFSRAARQADLLRLARAP